MMSVVPCPGCLQPVAILGGYGHRVFAVHQRRDGRRLCKFSGTRVRRSWRRRMEAQA